MPRRRRQPSPTGIHHVMNRGVDREPIFFADVDRIDFLGRLVELKADHGIETLAYCLMDNHYHLLVRELEDGDLSEGMHNLGLAYVRHTNDRVGRDGPLFRGRFHSLPVVTDAYLANASRYIHRNPLAMVGVDRCEEYRWSSYRSYLGHRRVPPFLSTAPLLELHGGVEAMAAFTADPDAAAAISTIADMRQLIALGLADAVATSGTESIRRSRRSDERTIMLLLAAQLGDGHLLTRQIDRHLDWPSDEARRKAVGRAQERSTTPQISRVVSLVRHHVRRAA